MSGKIPLNLYKKIHKTMPIPCVDVVIRRGNEFLMVKRNNKPMKGAWGFPGGRINKGETMEEAARRKIKEELGINIPTLKKLGVDGTIFKNEGPYGWTTHTINIVFSARINKHKKIILDRQHSECKWFSRAQADFHPYLKKFILLSK